MGESGLGIRFLAIPGPSFVIAYFLLIPYYFSLTHFCSNMFISCASDRGVLFYFIYFFTKSSALWGVY